MNRNELEQKLLLAESGELDAAARQELAARLAADPAATAWQGETQRLLAAARGALPAGMPSAAVRARIRAVAAARTGRHVPLHFPSIWMQGLAYAAALALIVGTWYWRGPTGRHTDRIAEMHALVAMTGAAEQPTAAVPEKGDTDSRLRALALDLLDAEGLSTDEAAGDIEPEEHGTTEPDAGAQSQGSVVSDRMA